MLLEVRPSTYVLLEQPAGSWGFKQEFMLSLSAALNLRLGHVKHTFVWFCLIYVIMLWSELASIKCAWYILICMFLFSKCIWGFASWLGWACLATIYINVHICERIWGAAGLFKNGMLEISGLAYVYYKTYFQSFWIFRSANMFLWKSTSGPVSSAKSLRRKMGKAERRFVAERFLRRQSNRARPKVHSKD